MKIFSIFMMTSFVLGLVSSVAATSGCYVEYYYWNADTNKVVGKLPPTMPKKNYRISIEARLNSNCPKGESAKLALYGPIKASRVENTGPYVVFSDDGHGDIYGKYFGYGDYHISSHFYTKDNAGGDFIAKRDYYFSVTDNRKRNLRESIEE
jgi:hypothetical protein